jgi:hypothetical protein
MGKGRGKSGNDGKDWKIRKKLGKSLEAYGKMIGR